MASSILGAEQLHPIAARTLRFVHGSVTQAQQFMLAPRVLRVDGDADAGRDAQLDPFGRNAGLCQRRADFSRHGQRIGA